MWINGDVVTTPTVVVKCTRHRWL